MKIMLHGATNCSNFGDYLFADLFFQKVSDCNKNGENIFFEFPKYGIGHFFRKGLGYTHKQTIGDVLSADMLVYISGGYFGERTTSFKESLRRLIRYLPIGMIFMMRRKPIFIIGVGGGPISNKLLRKSFCMVMNYATAITVRDEKTADYFKSYGVNKRIRVTSDTAQVITPELLPPLDDKIKGQIEEIFADKKIIFFHAVSNDKVNELLSEKVLPALNSFLESHKEYGVIVGCDEVYSTSVELNIKSKINTKSVYCYNYQEPWQLCSLLNKVDMIITTKLHVGIVGATLSKSVISFPNHSEKTKRYYKQIGEEDRCHSLREVNSEIVKDILELYHDKKINLNQNVLSAAKENLAILEEALAGLNKKHVTY